jgi:hypothetical protein
VIYVWRDKGTSSGVAKGAEEKPLLVESEDGTHSADDHKIVSREQWQD